MEALLKENSAQTEKELAKQLYVTQAAISKRLYAMKMIQKEGKGVPHELTEANIENRLTRYRRWHFLHQIVTDDEKWIYYDNPKSKKIMSSSRRTIHINSKTKHLWKEGYVVHLVEGETITAERYQQQLIDLNHELNEKRPISANKQRKLILLHDNSRPHVAKQVKNTLEALKGDILQHTSYSPDCAPSDYYLFQSMQSVLQDQHFRNHE